MTVLDVRKDWEWEEGHVEGAMHVYVGHLKEGFREVPRDSPVATVCASRRRSSIAASTLKAEEYEVSNVQRGMNAWKSKGFNRLYRLEIGLDRPTYLLLHIEN